MVAGLLSGSRERQLFSRLTTAGGVSLGRAVQSGSSFRMAAMVSETVAPAKAFLPLRASYSTQANAHMSLRASSGRPRACSGLM